VHGRVLRITLGARLLLTRKTYDGASMKIENLTQEDLDMAFEAVKRGLPVEYVPKLLDVSVEDFFTLYNQEHIRDSFDYCRQDFLNRRIDELLSEIAQEKPAFLQTPFVRDAILLMIRLVEKIDKKDTP
jgi:hypothetical protein